MRSRSRVGRAFEGTGDGRFVVAEVLYERGGVKLKNLPEVLAGHAVASALGVDVELTDLQNATPLRDRKRARRSAECDLHFQPTASVAAAGEVVTPVIESLRKQGNRLWHLQANTFSDDETLHRRWTVTLDHQADVDRSRRALPGLLSMLERTGLTRAARGTCGWTVSNLMCEAGVQHCDSRDALPHQSGAFRMFSFGTAGWGEGPQVVIDTCEEFMRSPIGIEKIDKLRASGADERHLVIVVEPPDWPHVYSELMGSSMLPHLPPDLPAAVDGFWVVASAPTARAIYWTRTGGWCSATIPNWTPPGFEWR